MDKGPGWWGQSYRHSLAARGISTRGLSSVEDMDDLSQFMNDERLDILKDEIESAKLGIVRDKRNLARMRDIDTRILKAMNDDEMDLAEILVDAKNGDPEFNLRASGVLQKIREKFTGDKSDLPLNDRVKQYRSWYEKAWDKHNKKIASAPSDLHIDEINAKFDKDVATKRRQFALTDADVTRTEMSVHSTSKRYPISERTRIQRERAAKYPYKMKNTSAAMVPYVETIQEDGEDGQIPTAIVRRFGDMDIAKIEEGTIVPMIGSSSPITQYEDDRALVLARMDSEREAEQQVISENLAREKSRARNEYQQELNRNRSLRSAVGTAMQEEWDIMDDEIALREQSIANAEKVLAAGGVRRYSGCLPTAGQSHPHRQLPHRHPRRRSH